MLVFFLILFCSLFIGTSVKRSGFFDDSMDRKQTDAIKGFFIWMVFFSHILLEVRASGFRPDLAVDTIGYRISLELGQLVIVPFLFYSGYGVMEAIMNRGRDYLDLFPRHRLLTTLLNFDVAVLCFIVLNLFMGVRMGMKQIGWSLIGWDSVGNSNWYIFVILYCYLVSWISGKFFPDSGVKIVVMTAFLVLAGEAALSFLKHGQHWWYDTMLCYPTGMMLSLYKGRITAFFKRFYLPVIGVLLALFLFLHFQSWLPSFRGLTYNAKSIVFALLIVLATMKVKTGNKFLYWSGLCVFPIYIYQRLPMRAFRQWAGDSWVCGNPYLFILLCAIVTGGISCFYKHWQVKFH